MKPIDADSLKDAISKPWMDKAQSLSDVLNLINAAPEVSTDQDESLSVDLLDFAQQVEGWHKVKVDNLHAVIETINEGITLKLGADGEELELNLDQALYFKLGLNTALGEFEKLPFTFTNNTEDEID